MPIPEGEELSAVHGICSPPMVSPEVLSSMRCSLTGGPIQLFYWCCHYLQAFCMPERHFKLRSPADQEACSGGPTRRGV